MRRNIYNILIVEEAEESAGEGVGIGGEGLGIDGEGVGIPTGRSIILDGFMFYNVKMEKESAYLIESGGDSLGTNVDEDLMAWNV